MENFKMVSPNDLGDNFFKVLNEEWALVTSGTAEKLNTMTVSWGGFGVLWNKPVATIYIRPQRYTYEFLEQNERFTISVLPNEFKDKLTYCGKFSGREVDKVKECGLTIVQTPNSVAFEEARLVIACRKLYHGDITPDNFHDSGIDGKNYPLKDYHRFYIGEIEAIYVK